MLRLKEIPVFEPVPGQVLVQAAAAGVNFMGIGVRSGIYGLERPLPFTLGVQGPAGSWHSERASISSA
jgi:NADPH:quinone reductase-like Zn-dependent oxidoreductase